MATASVDESLLKECLALGASEIILKPLDLKQLELAVVVALILHAQELPAGRPSKGRQASVGAIIGQREAS